MSNYTEPEGFYAQAYYIAFDDDASIHCETYEQAVSSIRNGFGRDDAYRVALLRAYDPYTGNRLEQVFEDTRYGLHMIADKSVIEVSC